MGLRRTFLLVALAILFLGAMHAYARNHWWMYEREMQHPVDDPPDNFSGSARKRGHSGTTG